MEFMKEADSNDTECGDQDGRPSRPTGMFGCFLHFVRSLVLQKLLVVSDVNVCLCNAPAAYVL